MACYNCCHILWSANSNAMYNENLVKMLQMTPDTTGIKFPDFKQAGVSLRSQRVGVHSLFLK